MDDDQAPKLRRPAPWWGLVAACLAVLGCSDVLGLGDPDLTVSLSVDPAFPSGVSAEFDVGGRLFVLDSAETRAGEAPDEGLLPVMVRVLSGGDTLVADAFDQRFRQSDDHWIHVLVDEQRPLGFCLGTVHAHGVAGSADSVFILYGSIPAEAFC